MRAFAFLVASVAAIIAPTDRQFECTVGADLYGEDLEHAELSMDKCLDECRQKAACNALTWTRSHNSEGLCYMKHLRDLGREPSLRTTFNAITCKTKAASWVLLPGVQIYGDDLATRANVASFDECTLLCTDTLGCTSVFYTRYGQTCSLKRSATTYHHVWSKAVDLGAVSAIQFSYKQCQANVDLYLQEDVTSFKGSFQDCGRCIQGDVHGFTWTPGPIDGMGTPREPLGQCFCKRLANRTLDPAKLRPSDVITCVD
ncbi:Aste57867_23391 [Aphanomyces stellatus]|uniref:Aste57867_23391 protein n=1 Tax=Aphanomyces stellatus TaxID=120398 RepID=A0A485LMI9_9STRA|nr:hypothetical protein As57867_023320 [Aphanomyces stellatus]VFU00037.1 Aste57867_23391 [Aphanomyces stellatus]